MRKEDIPDFPGELLKDVNWESNRAELIGKFSPFLSPHGKMVVQWMSYDSDKKEATFRIIAGKDEYKGKIAVSKVVPTLKFIAGTEMLLPFFLSI